MQIIPLQVGTFFRRHRVFFTFLIPALILLIALPLTVYLLSRPTGLHTHAQVASLPLTAYYGTWTKTSDTNAISLSQFESDAGKAVAIDHVAYVGWTSLFPQTQVDQARVHGSIPMVTWMSGTYTLADITNGSLDSYITSFATAAKTWGHPLFLRFDHEMNGNWYGWSEDTNGNKVGEFVPMWRHVHDIFTKVGATNVTWVWCPSHGAGEFDSLYPGDAYVDWTCLDGYNKYDPTSGNNSWDSFNQIFSSSYTDITTHLAPAKPLMIGEFSSTEDPQSSTRKASWFTDALTTQLPTNFPLIRAIVLFNVYHPQSQNFDYRIESSSNAQLAFKQAIASGYYATNTFGAIDCSNGFCPIPPPKLVNGQTTITASVCPHDIGKCGDNTNPTGLGNTSPRHATRPVNITFYSAGNTPVISFNGTVTYSSTGKNYQGTFNVSNFPSGAYTVKIKMTGYLVKQIDGIVTVTQGQLVNLPQATLVAADINSDNQINVLDYNALLSCFGAKVTTTSCTFPVTGQSYGADINDDGVVDGIDYNIFIREIANQSGSGNPTPNPTVSPTPSGCQPNAILVNPCRPWVGAAAKGNPGIPGLTKPATDDVSQFEYLEQLLGRPLDVFKDYHSAPTVADGINTLPLDPNSVLGKAELHFVNRQNTYIDINWNPSQTWLQSMPVSQGGDPTINADIDKTAGFIKAVAPHKIFLSMWHEADLLVSQKDNSSQNCSDFSTGDRAAGSPSQFNAAWQNIYNRFKADGVTNVIWTVGYASYEPKTCWVPYLWPGNSFVDWVSYDTYSRGKTWDETAGVFYNFLDQHSTQTVNFDSKPWRIGEFGTCQQPTTGISDAQYYDSVKAAIDADSYPRLKMYIIYADTGNNSGPGCLTDYDANGTYDFQKEVVVNQLFNDSHLR